MGEVIAFQPGARRRAAATRSGGTAEILFFLGVRYCRQEDETGETPRPRGAGATSRSRPKKHA